MFTVQVVNKEHQHAHLFCSVKTTKEVKRKALEESLPLLPLLPLKHFLFKIISLVVFLFFLSNNWSLECYLYILCFG